MIPYPATHENQAAVHFRPRRRRAPRETTVLNLAVVPMVDIVFLLLTFFMCTTTLRRAEGLLPSQLSQHGRSGAPNAAAEVPLTPLIVHLSQSGPGPRDYVLRVENFANVPTTFPELAAFLKDVQTTAGFDADTPVIIQTDGEVLWDHVVGCWNAAVRAGCRRIAFGLD